MQEIIRSNVVDFEDGPIEDKVTLKPGKNIKVRVFHTDDCSIWIDGVCDCLVYYEVVED